MKKSYGYELTESEGIALKNSIHFNRENEKSKSSLTDSEKFRILFGHFKDAIAIIELHGNTVIDVNSAFCSLFSCSGKDVISKPLGSLKEPEIFREIEKAIMQTGSGATGRNVFTINQFNSLKETCMELTLDLAESDGLSYAIATLRDITERNKADQRLNRLKKRSDEELKKFQRAVNQSSSLIVITNSYGVIEYINPKFTAVTGYEPDEVAGKTPAILKSGETSEEKYKQLWKTIKSGKEWHGEFHNRKKNGELFWDLSSISPVVNEKGDITHFIGVKEDITRRKTAEEELRLAKEVAEKSERLKTEFLAQVSHEIRTPVNTIMSVISLLKDELEGKLSEELRSGFKIIDNGSRRLIRTIDLILNMSQVQSGNLKVTPAEMDLGKEILENLIFDFHSAAKLKGLQLNYINNESSSLIMGDSYTINQIFVNLIDNAIKFTSKGSVDVEVFRDEDKRLCVEIRDTGVGISEEYLPYLFTPFSQEETGYTRKFDGNGLGLALVQQYVQLNDAEIRIRSRKNEGSAFTVIFSHS